MHYWNRRFYDGEFESQNKVVMAYRDGKVPKASKAKRFYFSPKLPDPLWGPPKDTEAISLEVR
jgi:hypothetical protein